MTPRQVLVILLLLLGGCSAQVTGSAPGGPASTETLSTEATSTEATSTEATSTEATSTEAAEMDDVGAQLHPDVVAVDLSEDADGTFTVAVTLSSPYDTPQRYADAWRVLSVDGEVLGIRELTHDHAGEQPFTRSQYGIVIPQGIDEVVVQGRDLANGWGGEELTAPVPGR